MRLLITEFIFSKDKSSLLERLNMKLNFFNCISIEEKKHLPEMIKQFCGRNLQFRVIPSRWKGFSIFYFSRLLRFPFGYEGYSHNHSHKEKQSKSKSGIQRKIPYLKVGFLWSWHSMVISSHSMGSPAEISLRTRVDSLGGGTLLQFTSSLTYTKPNPHLLIS